MKHHLVAFCLVISTAFADADRHRQAATELLTMAGGPQMLMGGMEAMMEPMEAMWRQQGATEEIVAALRKVTREWMAEDIKWSELEPRFVDVYVREFSEAELREVIAFYKTETGQKALKRLPVLMAECAKIGQEYGVTKQDALRIRMEEALKKFQPSPEKP